MKPRVTKDNVVLIGFIAVKFFLQAVLVAIPALLFISIYPFAFPNRPPAAIVKPGQPCLSSREPGLISVCD